MISTKVTEFIWVDEMGESHEVPLSEFDIVMVEPYGNFHRAIFHVPEAETRQFFAGYWIVDEVQVDQYGDFSHFIAEKAYKVCQEKEMVPVYKWKKVRDNNHSKSKANITHADDCDIYRALKLKTSNGTEIAKAYGVSQKTISVRQKEYRRILNGGR